MKTTESNYDSRLRSATEYLELKGEDPMETYPKLRKWNMSRVTLHFFSGGMFLMLGLLFDKSLNERNNEDLIVWVDGILERRDSEVILKSLQK